MNLLRLPSLKAQVQLIIWFWIAWLEPIFVYGPKLNWLSLPYPSFSLLNSRLVTMAGATAIASLCNFTGNPCKAIRFPVRSHSLYFPKLNFASLSKFSGFGWKAVRLNKLSSGFSCNCFSTISTNTTHYEVTFFPWNYLYLCWVHRKVEKILNFLCILLGHLVSGFFSYVD